jgi:large subunit ribosomal protein L22
MPEAKALLRYVRVPPRKARAVVDLIRGQPVPHALSVLKYTPRVAAKVVEKLLRSAVANAEQRELGEADTMRVTRAFVDCGPIYKRFQPRAQGRAFSIHKRTSHITVVVEAPEAASRAKGGKPLGRPARKPAATSAVKAPAKAKTPST